MKTIQKNPRVSIGLPVYNGDNFLTTALDSLLSQSFEDFELIISDNASTDRTQDICREYASKDRRIRYYRNKQNLGAAKNYNHVFKLSTGQYFKWASYDDVWAQEYLRRCVEVLDAAPQDVVLCYPKTTLIDKEGKIIEIYNDNTDIRYARPHQRLRSLVRNLRKCNALLGLIRTNHLQKTKLIGGYFASDMALLVELCLYGQFWELPEKLFFRRLHEKSSRANNRSYQEVSKWFDPTNNGKYDMRLTRLFFENLLNIHRAPMSISDKTLCNIVLINEWLKRYWRVMGGECKRFLRQKFTTKTKNYG